MQRFNDINPSRWRFGNPQAPASMQVAKRHDHAGGTESGFFEDINAVVGEGYNDAIMRFGREQRPDGSVAMNIVSSEMSLALYASTFWRSFRNVIAIDPDLMTLLEQTSADDLPLAAIRFPFPFFHVAFPPDNGMSLPGPHNEIDGVYVDTRMEGMLQLCITCRRLDRTPNKRNYPRVIERTFGLAGEMKPDETVGGFVRRMIEEKVAGLLASHDVWNGIADAMNDSDAGHAGGRHFTSVATENNAHRADDAEEGLPSALKALGMVMSVLSYLSTDHGTVTDYSPAPPQRLAQKLRNGTEKQRRQAREDAFRLGIIPIQVVGRGILSDEERGLLTDREVRPHWRRGHIRRVWMDGGRERYEVRWIRPVIVNRHKGEPVGMHIHTVVPAPGGDSGSA